MIQIHSHFMEVHLKESLSAMQRVHSIFSNYEINHCFIGGAVLPFYDYRRMTDDVDVLVSAADKYRLKEIPIGLMRDVTRASTDVRRMQLHEPRTEVEIIYSGDDFNQTGFSYPEPGEVSTVAQGMPILTLKALVTFKVRSGVEARGRVRDLGDAQELIRQNNLPLDFLSAESREVQDKYQELWFGVNE
jgi:hypothetical protein